MCGLFTNTLPTVDTSYRMIMKDGSEHNGEEDVVGY